MEGTMIFGKNSLIAWGLVVAVVSAGVFLAGAGTGFARSAAYCDDYARDAADHYGGGGRDVVGGAIGGAATGAILGGIIGGGRGAGTGAAIGGGVGALGGSAQAADDWNRVYNRSFNRCMSEE
jgi:hypothetical protein